MTLTSIFQQLRQPSKAQEGDNKPSAFDPNVIGVLSASCCNATSATLDTQVMTNLQAAMALACDHRLVIVENVTSLRKNMKQLRANADSGRRALLESIQALFQDNGLSVFPMLIINGRVAFYGGVPEVDRILEVLTIARD